MISKVRQWINLKNIKQLPLEIKELLTLSVSALVLIVASTIFFTTTDAKQAQINRGLSVQRRQLSTAEELVQILEGEQSLENLNKAQKAVDKLKSSKRKTQLQERITAVRANIDAQSAQSALISAAESAVSLYEGDPSDDNLASAQAAVDVLPDGEAKDSFNARIQAVKDRLAAEAQAKATEQATNQASQADQNTQGYDSATTDTGSVTTPNTAADSQQNNQTVETPTTPSTTETPTTPSTTPVTPSSDTSNNTGGNTGGNTDTNTNTGGNTGGNTTAGENATTSN